MNVSKMYNSLLALSVADAAGENSMKLIIPKTPVPDFYKAGNVAAERIESEFWPDPKWPWTDDTHMGIGVFRTLRTFGEINQVELAREFGRNFKEDKLRGYGRGTHGLLAVYNYAAEEWYEHSRNWWGPGQGSKGNGSAMRDAIIGAAFEDLDRVVVEARKSAEVTHFHEEAIAGSIAVAVAANVATYGNVNDYWTTILKYTPAGVVRDAIEWVAKLSPQHSTNWEVIAKVGNGKKVTALDTVPFALWQADQLLLWKSVLTFADGINSIIEVGGDTDTVAAMVGGIVGNTIEIPQNFINHTEPLPSDIHP